MSTCRSSALTAALVLLTPLAARGDLVGDEVSIRIRVPNLSGFDQTKSTTVTADASDVLTYKYVKEIWIIDPESAVQWANTIADDRLRAKALGSIKNNWSR